MSNETYEWKRDNILVGYTDDFGRAWWDKGATRADGTPNHFPAEIPLSEVKALLGITFSARRVYYETADGGLREAEDRRAWVRDSTEDLIEIHSEGYQGHQFLHALVRNVELILGEGLGIGGAGLLKKGAVGYVQVQMPKNLTVHGIDFRPWLMATTSFDGSIATTYKKGVTKVLCDNTRGMALVEPGERHVIKHTRNSELRVNEARQALAILNEHAEAFAAEVETLLAVDVSDQQWSKFLEAYAPIKEDATSRSITMAENKRGELNKLWCNDNRVSPWSGTAYGVVQAVNTFVHHVGIVRGADRVERNMLRAATGGADALDRATVELLGTVLDRDLALVTA